MNDRRTVELIEDYKDAEMALIMDQYAQANGERILQAFEAAEQAGTVAEMPAKLDKKCRTLIRRAYTFHWLRPKMKSTAGFARRVAAVFLVLFAFCSFALPSTNAKKVPQDYKMWHYDTYVRVEFSPAAFTPDPVPLTPEAESRRQDPLAGMLPSKYTLLNLYDTNRPAFSCVYHYDFQEGVVFAIRSAHGTSKLFTEERTLYEITFAGADAILREGTSRSLMWKDQATQMVFSLSATGLTEAEFWDLANQIAEYPDWTTVLFGE